MNVKLRAVKLTSLPVTCRGLLILPHVTSPPFPDNLDIRHLTDSHSAFYLTSDTSSSSVESAAAKAAQDIASIHFAFPSVTSDHVVLLMSAWFAYLCAVDDEVESMEPETATEALSRTIEMLRTGSRDLSPISKSVQGMAKLDALTKAFEQQMRAFLTLPQYYKITQLVADVWQAMLEEIVLRATPHPTITDTTYMDIRSQTVGLAPFFWLLRSALPPSPTANPTPPRLADQLAELQTTVARLTGLQNDLLGLRKDLAVAESANIVLVKAARSEGQHLGEAVEETVQMHNALVARTLRLRAKIAAESQGERCTMGFVDEVVGFVERHFAWASRAERYCC